jgi:hypothetical protein
MYGCGPRIDSEPIADPICLSEDSTEFTDRIIS